MSIEKLISELDPKKSIYLHYPERAQSIKTIMDSLDVELSSMEYRVIKCTSLWNSLLEIIKNRDSTHILNLERNILSFFCKTKICWLHGGPASSMSLLRYYLVKFYTTIAIQKGRITVVVSDLLNSTIKTNFNVKSRILVISNLWALDKKVFKRNNQNLIGQRELDIIYVGRMTRLKKIDKIESIFNILSKKGLLVGMYGLPEFKSKYYFGNLEYPNSVAEIMKKSKAIINLNEFEPYGLTLMEGHRSGCKVICTHATGAIKDIINENGDLLLLSENDEPNILSKQILSFLEYKS